MLGRPLSVLYCAILVQYFRILLHRQPWCTANNVGTYIGLSLD